MPHFGICKSEFERTIVKFETNMLEFFKMQRFALKKFLKFGTKMRYLGTLSIYLINYWSQHFSICQNENFHVKQKSFKFGKLQSFNQHKQIWNNLCHIWNQHLRIFENAKFSKKMVIFKFKTIFAFFGYFWNRIWNFTITLLKKLFQTLLNWKSLVET